MQIEIRHDFGNLEELTGAVVIIDIYRAGNTILSLLAGGSTEVWLVNKLADARALAKEKSLPLVGERKSLAPPDFAADNSPVEVSGGRFKEQAVVLTTSGGTRFVHRLKDAKADVFFGTFAAAEVLLDTLQNQGYEDVTLLPVGLEGVVPCDEDNLAAWYFRRRLLGLAADFEDMQAKLMSCPNAQRLRARGLQQDLDFCASFDTHRILMQVMFDGPYPRVVKA